METRHNLAVAATLLIAAGACGEPPSPRIVPDALVGVWLSDDPRYADRFFAIQDSSIVFGVGNGKVEFYNHRGFDSELVSGRNLYTMYYSRRPRGQKLQFAFYQRGREIRLKNQPTVRWFRQTR